MCEFSPVTATGNVITENTATYGGGVDIEYSSVSAANCLIARNEATVRGGGFLCRDVATLTAVNCTIADNASPNGRGLACASRDYPAHPTITNSILWDGGDEVRDEYSNSTITIT
jgi:hypothetical protein